MIATPTGLARMTDAVPTLAEASRLIATGALSPVELTRAALARAEALEPRLHAFITLLPERALAAARNAEAELARGERRGPLHGIPYALKDIIDVAGVATTAHSRLLRDNIADANADVTSRLENAGMVLLGKTSLHEFARGGPGDDLPWPNARNPWNADHSCGGSSSGSAVAVAAGMVGLAIGTDTGGSVRFPAACTGIVGLKPTYDCVSRRGVIPLSFSLDHVGTLTRTVADCALAFAALVEHDSRDAGFTAAGRVDDLSALDTPVAGMRIGVARAYNAESAIDEEQQEAVEQAAFVLSELGAQVDDVTLPPRDLYDAATWTIILAEGFSIHQQDLQQRADQYGRTARERLSIGALVTAADYVRAQRLRKLLIAETDDVLAGFDAMLCAGAISAPPRLDQVDDGPWRKRHPITAPFNLTGHPALAVPAGAAASGLPLSLQLVGKRFEETTLLRIGHALERSVAWGDFRPPWAR